MKTFAECLKYAMTQAGMNQSSLSEKSGCSKAAISHYLSGKYTPSPDRVKILADATGSSFEFLMGYEAIPAPKVSTPSQKITTRLAAQCLGKSEQFIRIGLQRGLLPFGTAVPGSGDKWNYDIRPEKFREYIGEKRFNEFFGLTA